MTERQLRPEKLTSDMEYERQAALRASWIHVSDMGSFFYYAQLTNYSCGPACVKMALRYLTGEEYDERIIRIGCNTTTTGTYLADMEDYINRVQDEYDYSAKYLQLKVIMKSNLYTGIATYDAPPIIGIEESTNTGWPFDLPGHFVIIYSIKSDKSEVAIADPWAGYVSSTSSYKWYDKSTDDLYSAYDSADIGYMY